MSLVMGSRSDGQTFNPLRIDENDNLKTITARKYQTDVTDGTIIYDRYWSGTGNGVIYKTYLIGTVWTTVWAYGAWADRADLSYIPIDQELTIS